MRRKIWIWMLAAVAVLGTAACGSTKKTETEPGPSAEKVTAGSFRASEELDPQYACTIEVVGSWGNFEALDQAALDFREYYPNVEVVYSPLNDAAEDIKNRMASGKGIDIYMHNWLNTNNPSKSYLWENAMDLTETALAEAPVDPKLKKTGYVDGKLKLVPIYRRLYGFMVNEDLLEDHGLTVPETYDQFLSCCETLKEAGIPPVLIQGSHDLAMTYSQHIAGMLLTEKDRDQAMADLAEGKDSTGAVGQTLRMMADLKDKGYIHPDSGKLPDEYEGVILRFFEGDIPFVPYNSEMFSGTRKREAKSESYTEKPFLYSLVPFPGEKGYECVYEQLGTVYMGIYDGMDEEKKAYVVELLRYLLSDEGSLTLEYVKNMPGTNLYTGFTDFPYYKKLTDEQIFPVGEDGLPLDVSELLSEGYVHYEYGITAEEYLEKAMDYIAQKNS